MQSGNIFYLIYLYVHMQRVILIGNSFSIGSASETADL